MGEAWGDWYANDYLVSQGLEIDKKGKADLDIYKYDGLQRNPLAGHGLHALVADASRCPGGATGHSGGYTYADYGKVFGVPEIHADGEIWGQTLWSLRDKVGSRVALGLVTRAMELAPFNPSFLDMRNALLVADTTHHQGKYHAKIWNTFASRGMGFYAGSLGADDSAPSADTKTPPNKVKTGVLTGTVKDIATGQPVGGVPVTLAFQGQGVANPTAITAADGTYAIGPVPTGHYGKLTVNGAGYVPISRDVTVAASGSASDFSVVRDWVAVKWRRDDRGLRRPRLHRVRLWSRASARPLALDRVGQHHGQQGTPTNVFAPKYLTVDMGARSTSRLRGRPQRDLW